MNKAYRYILYFLMALVGVAAVLFLVFGDDILSSQNASGDLQGWFNGLEVNPVSGVPEDLLEHPVLSALVNYSPSFDIEKICSLPSTGTSQVPCTQGNSRPFFVEKK